MASKRTTNDGAQSPPATKLTTTLHSLYVEIPGFTLLDNGAARPLGAKWTIDPKYIEATIATVVASPKLQTLTGFDPEAARAAIRIDAAYATPEAVSRELAEGIHGMRMVQYASAIDQCDHVFAMTRAMLKQPKATLTPEQLKELEGYQAAADNMTRTRKVRRKTSATPKLRATPKKAVRKAKQATAEVVRAKARADRAAARARSVAARVVGTSPAATASP